MNTFTLTLKRTILIIAALGVVSTFLGCNTAHGFGQDVEKTGEKIKEKTE